MAKEIQKSLFNKEKVEVIKLQRKKKKTGFQALFFKSRFFSSKENQ